MDSSESPTNQPPSQTGSPFKPGSFSRRAAVFISTREAVGEGVARETAAAACISSLLLIGFATVGWFWFPLGGVLIGGLGVAMGGWGLSSRHRAPALVALLCNAAILAACYVQL